MNTSVNSSLNLTASPGLQVNCVDSSFAKASVITKVFFLSIITVVSFVGNILIIFVVYKNPTLRRTINYFIVNIAISDLILPTLLLPREIVETARLDKSWSLPGVLGQIACKWIYFLSDVSPTVSILSLIFMTIDRFLAVVFPLRVTLMNSRRRYILISLTWIISAGFFSPYFYAMDVTKLKDGKNYCVLVWSRDGNKHITVHKAFSAAASILFLVIPFFTLTILYSIILIKTRATPELIRTKTCPKARLRQKKTAKRVTLMAFVIVLIFGLCWGPYYILLFLLIFVWNWRRPAMCHWPTFLFAVQFLCYSNAAINPCAYFIFIKNFRRGLMKQFTTKKSRMKQQFRAQKQSESLITSIGVTAKSTNISSAETCI